MSFEKLIVGRNDFQNVAFMNIVQRDPDVCRKDGNIRMKNDNLQSKSSHNHNDHHHSNLYHDNHYYANDYQGFEAISHLHSLIDDDNDGDLDRSESQEFLEEDLNRAVYTVGASHYHSNNDLVSVDELWNYWLHSEVYNWTVGEVVDWLVSQVDLAQYSDNFRVHEVNGKLLPRLASSLHSPLYSVLGVRNVFHRQKITLKSTDIVLFGPTKVQHRYFPDAIFFISLLLAVLSSLVGLRQRKMNDKLLSNLNSELSLLQGVQENLNVFQAQLDESHKKRREEEEDRDELRKKLEKRKRIFKICDCESDKEVDDCDDVDGDNGGDNDDDNSDDDNNGGADDNDDNGGADDNGDNGDDVLVMGEKGRFVQLRKELTKEMVKLFEAQTRLEVRRKHSSTPALQQWFQMTYEVETRYWRDKKALIERKLNSAIKKCEKLKRQRFKFLSSIKEDPSALDGALLFEREMEGLRGEMRERNERWATIERLTSLNIITNPGIPYLNSLLSNNVAESMSSNNLFAMNFQPNAIDAYPVKSNLLRAGMQLSAIGVNASRTFTVPSEQQKHSHSLVSSAPLNLDHPDYQYLYHNHPANLTHSNHIGTHSDFSSASRLPDNASMSSFSSIPKSHLYPSSINPLPTYSPPRRLKSPLTIDTFNRLASHSINHSINHSSTSKFCHSKTLSDFIHLAQPNHNIDPSQYKSSSDLGNSKNNKNNNNNNENSSDNNSFSDCRDLRYAYLKTKVVKEGRVVKSGSRADELSDDGPGESRRIMNANINGNEESIANIGASKRSVDHSRGQLNSVGRNSDEDIKFLSKISVGKYERQNDENNDESQQDMENLKTLPPQIKTKKKKNRQSKIKELFSKK